MIRKALELSPKAKSNEAQLWGNLADLCDKTRYWLYTRKQKASAERYVDRLEKALSQLPKNDLAIVREEGLALLFELQGRIDQAIVHRQREIQLMQRLHDEARSPAYSARTRAYMLRGRGPAVLQKRLTILESLKMRCAAQNHKLFRKAQ